ncbi:MAG: glycosyltransferase family 39 protein [Novosphingobium sp.]
MIVALRRQWPIALILLSALGLRLYSIRFGLPALNDPDELMFELGSMRMLRGPTLNPGWFGHPATTTMYVLAIVDVAVFVTGWIAGWFPTIKDFATAIYADPAWMILPGRIAMTLFALGTIQLTFQLATRLFDRSTGLFAAGLLAVSPVHLTWSQIIRSDMMASFFMLLCLLSALAIARHDRRWDYGLAALWLGAAIATKWPFALSALAIGGAVWLLLRDGRISWRQAAGRLLATGLLAGLLLFLISPYLLLDYPTVLRNLNGEGQARHLGATGGSLWQNARWYLTGPLYSGLGAAGLALLPVGIVFVWRAPTARALLLPVAGGFFVVLCTQTLLWERWALPLLPFCAIAIGVALTRLTAGFTALWRQATLLILGLLIALPLLARARDDARARLNDTRQIATAWARAHIPSGSSVLIEHFAFDLVSQPWRLLFPVGDAGCVDVIAFLQGKMGYGLIDQARGSRANLDYGTMAPARRGECQPDFAILTEYERYLNERAAFPTEYMAYRELLAHGKIVARFAPQAGVTGGRSVVIVRFDGPHQRSLR